MRINERIRHITVNDHETEKFEGLWSLPFGVSYNSYLIVDEKIALVDTAGAEYADFFLDSIKEEIGDRTIDYVIVNHMEPDHSALLSIIRENYPDVTILCSAKAVGMIDGYHGITDGVRAVKDKESISLGNSTLTFYMTPMVHWPETMMTYLAEEKTFFTGDAFGAFMANDENNIDGFNRIELEMSRYYASIVGKYGTQVQMALKKAAGLEINRICSTHGPIWEDEIYKTISLYDSLSKYEPIKKGVCLVYGSMYGNTEKAALDLASELDKLGVEYQLHNLSKEDASFAYRDAFRYSHIVTGAPTYNNDIYPPVYNFLYGLGARLLKNRKFFAFGSYTWAGASVKLMNAMAEKCGWELIAEGKSFNQGWTKEKCDLSEIAQAIATDCK